MAYLRLPPDMAGRARERGLRVVDPYMASALESAAYAWLSWSTDLRFDLLWPASIWPDALESAAYARGLSLDMASALERAPTCG